VGVIDTSHGVIRGPFPNDLIWQVHQPFPNNKVVSKIVSTWIVVSTRQLAKPIKNNKTGGVCKLIRLCKAVGLVAKKIKIKGV